MDPADNAGGATVTVETPTQPGSDAVAVAAGAAIASVAENKENIEEIKTDVAIIETQTEIVQEDLEQWKTTTTQALESLTGQTMETAQQLAEVRPILQSLTESQSKILELLKPAQNPSQPENAEGIPIPASATDASQSAPENQPTKAELKAEPKKRHRWV